MLTRKCCKLDKNRKRKQYQQAEGLYLEIYHKCLAYICCIYVLKEGAGSELFNYERNSLLF